MTKSVERTQLIQQKINNFVAQNKDYQNSSIQEILSVMVETGYLNINELNELQKNSLFDEGLDAENVDKTVFSMKSKNKTPQGTISQVLTKRLNIVSANLQKAKEENGIIGGLWSGFKNLTGI